MSNLSEFARLLALALLNYADDEGYFYAHPSLIRGQVFPFLEDSKKIPGAIEQLVKAGYLAIGTGEGGRSIGWIKNFDKHQRVDKPQASKIKASARFQEPSTNSTGTIQNLSKEEGNGREGNKEGKEEGKGTNGDLPAGRIGTLEELHSFALEIGQPASDGEACFYGWEANGWTLNGKAIKNWKAAMRNWKARGWLPSQKAGQSQFSPVDHRAAKAAREYPTNDEPLPAL